MRTKLEKWLSFPEVSYFSCITNVVFPIWCAIVNQEGYLQAWNVCYTTSSITDQEWSNFKYQGFTLEETWEGSPILLELLLLTWTVIFIIKFGYFNSTVGMNLGIWGEITNGAMVESAGDSETLVTLHIPFDTFRIFVFYDTCFRTTAPGIGARRRYGFSENI